MTWSMDREGRITSLIPPAVYGYAEEELLGRRFTDFLPPEGRGAVQREMSGVQAGAASAQFDFVFLHKDGTRVCLSGTVTALRDKQGRALGVLGTCADITANQLAEEALRRYRELYRVLVESAQDAVITIDKNGLIRFVNPATTRTFGYPASELLGQPLTLLMPECLRALHQAGFERYVRAGERHVNWQGTETIGRRKNGDEFPIEASFGEVAIDGQRTFTGFVRDITERKRAAEARGLLAAIVESSDDAIIGKTLDGIVQSWNLGAQRIYGYSAQEIIGHPISMLAPPDCRDEIPSLLTGIGAGQAIENFETRRVRKDGQTIDVSLTISPMRDAAGRITGASAIARDITARKKTEAALRESELKFRQLAENVSEVFWIADVASGRILYVSPAYEQVWGRTCASLYQDGRSFLDAVHPDDRARIAAAYEKQRSCLAAFHEEYRIVRPDGANRWILGRSFPVTDDTGQVYRFVGIAEDLTGRRQAEEELQRSEAYLAESQNLSHVGSWAWDLATPEMVLWSREHYRIFGFDPEPGPLPRVKVLERVHAADRRLVHRAFERAMVDRRTVELVFRIALPDGSIRHIQCIGHPVADANGAFRELIGTSMDVTERRQADAELRQSFERLRALAARLQRVREEERTRVAREIHDELGQALTALKIELSALVQALPARWKRPSEKPESILKLIDETIQSVRKIASELRPGILDDLGLVAAVEWAAREFQARSGVRCRLVLPRRDIVIDPERATALFRICQETLTNVARHARATQVTVRLARLNGSLLLKVRDNGAGATEAQLAAGGSLGILGMRERALLLGGEFSVRGIPGRGTTVTVRVPDMPPSPMEANP